MKLIIVLLICALFSSCSIVQCKDGIVLRITKAVELENSTTAYYVEITSPNGVNKNSLIPRLSFTDSTGKYTVGQVLYNSFETKADTVETYNY
jgi:hypothetical protein